MASALEGIDEGAEKLLSKVHGGKEELSDKLARAEMRGRPRPEKQKADGDQSVEAANSPLSIVMLVQRAVAKTVPWSRKGPCSFSASSRTKLHRSAGVPLPGQNSSISTQAG